MTHPPLSVRPLAPEHASALAALFEDAGSCYCRWWHFEGDRHAWLGQCASSPEGNRAAMLEAVETGAERGVTAWRDERLIGWLKLSPASALPKLYEQRLYRGLHCLTGDRAGVLCIGCLLVRATERRRGVARALVEGALALARREGARAVEAFPKGGGEQPDELLWTGGTQLYVDAGFQLIHDFPPYPVLRYELRP